jgi:hypothetical protein
MDPRAGLDVCEKSRPHRNVFCLNALYLFSIVHSHSLRATKQQVKCYSNIHESCITAVQLDQCTGEIDVLRYNT